MTFYAELSGTHQLLSIKKRTLSILLEIHTFYVCLSTIETRFYPASKSEKNAERLLKSPKVTAFVDFNARHGLLGPTGLKKPVKRPLSMLPRYRDVIKNLSPDDFYDDFIRNPPSLESQLQMAWFIQHGVPTDIAYDDNIAYLIWKNFSILAS